MFYDRFMELCKWKGVSPAAVTRKLGLNNSSSTAWKRGSIPKGDTLQKLADYFGVSVDYLLGQHHLKGILDVEVGDILNRILSEVKRSGISYEEFCGRLGLPFDEWFHWKEASSQSYLEHLPQIARILNIPEDELSRGYTRRKPVEAQIRTALLKLNEDGKEEAVKRVEELTEIPRYKRAETAPEPPPTTAPAADGPGTPPEGE